MTNANSSLETFNHLMDEVTALLVERYQEKEFHDSEVDGSKFEKVVFETIQILLRNTKESYANWIPTLVSGKKFPDIVLQINENDKFGIEVKTSKGDGWKTLGGSIMESTRVEGVTHVNILFAKLDPFVVRYKTFEHSISDVAVTHSPRYLIDLDVPLDETIFKKINIDYDSIWKSEKPFEHFRQYFKNKAAKEKTGLWWIEDDISGNTDNLPRIQIQFFSQLPKEKKDHIVAKSMALFPHIFSNVADYNEISVWLVNMGILNNSLRDTYSSGSNEEVLGFLVPSKFRRLREQLINIHDLFKKIKNDEELLKKYGANDPVVAYNSWIKQIKSLCEKEHLPFLNALFNEIKFT